MKIRNLFALVVLAFICITSLRASQRPRFLPNDPLWQDNDNLTIPKPTDRPLSKTVDLMQKTFTKPKEGQLKAVDVNTLGEVPDSSWFTNRIGVRDISIEELVRGPNKGGGPDLSQPVQIIHAKTDGITPGLLIKDAKGDRYLFKFDPLHFPQMTSSTEVVATKFFYAFGYNTAENYLAYWNPNSYVLNKKGLVIWDTGKREPISKGYVKELLSRLPKRSDGTVQVMASKFLLGEPLGPFDYEGTRVDDPNDIFLHQDRRELRGLKIFDAWMNHNDSDSVNSLDMYYTDEQNRKYVKHYLIDFGSVFGSGANLPHSRRVGNEYYLAFHPTFAALGTFGMWERWWHHIKYPPYESLGRFESSNFDPAKWLPDYPNPAHDKMQVTDAFWATRIVSRFSDDAIRAIVKTGNWEEPGAEDYLIKTLIDRRNKILRFYLSQMNPISDFTVTNGSLTFQNIGVNARLSSSCSYSANWFEFDNDIQQTKMIGNTQQSADPKFEIPASSANYLLAQILSNCEGQPKWKDVVNVYLRGRTEVVGIER